MVEQLLPRQDLAGVAQEDLQQRELPGRQVHLRAGDLHPPGAQVEPEAAGRQRRLPARLGRLVLRLAQPQPDPGQQLGEPERLGHVVVGAALERGHGVRDRVARGQHDHRHPGALGAELVEHLEAVQPGQPDVEHHQVVGAAQRLVQAGVAVGDRGHHVPLGLESLGDEGGDPLLVLHDQDAGHACSSSVGRVISKRAPGEASVTATDAAVRLGDGADDGQPEPEPVVAGRAPRPGRSARRCAPGPSGATPGPVSRTHSVAARAVVRRPDRDDVAGTGVLHGVLGELQQRLGQPLLVGHAG